MHIEVPRLLPEMLGSDYQYEAEYSAQVRARVEACRQRQLTRNNGPNSRLEGRQLDRVCALEPDDLRLVFRAMEQLGLSARAFHRILRLARTIADLAGSAPIQTSHLSEAIGYRRLDRRIGVSRQTTQNW
jgi:magnesium chelatase family protein